MAHAQVARWNPTADSALRAAVAAHGRSWATIRAAVQAGGAHGQYAPLLAHLGAPASKCLRKRWDKLAAWDAAAPPQTPPLGAAY